jgi:hypothetical protein
MAVPLAIPLALGAANAFSSWMGNRSANKREAERMRPFNELWGQAGQGPMDPRFEQAGQYFGNMQNLGMGGMRALAGDPRATQNLMNPYEQQVMSAMDPMFAKARAGAMNTIGDQATRARAFGGSRQGVAQGVALGNIANQQAQTMASLRYQGFGDAMGRAGQLANLGMGAAQAGGQMGQYAQDRSFNQRLQTLQAQPGQQQVPQGDPLGQGLGMFSTLYGTGLFG